MSGICGIVSLDDKHIESEDLAKMKAVLETRGPDGSRHWIAGSVGLGHSLLATTPESLSEELPFTHKPTGCTITADIRLDNREDLIVKLGLDQREKMVGDGELALSAYLKWGHDCPSFLLGDFAFAIWDPRRKCLFAARDQMGMRQVNYRHLPGRAFAFATEPLAIQSVGWLRSELNDQRIADFFEDFEYNGYETTFFKDILRLPPGHSITVSTSGIEKSCYWRLNAPARLHLKNEEAYKNAFLDVFTSAVDARLRRAKPVASMLSGGIDSSSVSAIAAKLLEERGDGPLLTVSAIGPDESSCLETRLARSTARLPNFDPAFVCFDELGDIGKDLSEASIKSSDPFDGHMDLVRAVYLIAKRRGANIVLDGVASDNIFAPGNYIGEMFLAGSWARAFAEARSNQVLLGSKKPALFDVITAAGRALAPSWIKRLAGKESGKLSFTGARARSICSPILISGRERYDRVAAEFAIEPRDPFMDVRVIEFALSLPPEQLVQSGMRKAILRKSIQGAVPENVRLRVMRSHLGGDFTREIMRIGWSNRRESITRSEKDLRELIEMPGLKGSQIPPSYGSWNFDLNQTAYIASWLETIRNQELNDAR